MYIEFDGFELARALKGPERDALAEALVGCTFYPAESVDDEGFAIESVNPDTARVGVRTSAGKPHDVPLTRGVVASSPGVRAAIVRMRALLEAPEPQDVATLRAAGVNVEMTRADAKFLATALTWRDLPDQQDRFAFWSITKRHGLSDLLAATVRKWAGLVRGPMPADLAIRLVLSQRAAKEYDRALETVAVGLADPASNSQQHGILLTQQAVVLLDMYDETGDQTSLSRACDAYRSALRIDPQSPYLRRVAGRIDRYGGC